MTNPDPAHSGRELAWLRRTALALGAAYVAAFVFTGAARASYRFELEWMEGAMLDSVLRVLRGQKLYVAPTIHYVPFIYPPLYFYVSAAACRVFGAGLFALRFVSFASTLGCIALIFRFVQRETRDVPAAAAAAGLYAATFAAGGGWFDLARIDSLFMCLLLAASYALRFWSRRFAQIAGGVLLALAFATKQLALPAALPMLAFALCCERRWFAVAALATGITATWALDAVHSGWYRYYVFAVPARHALSLDSAGELLRMDVLETVPIAGALGAAWLCMRSDGKPPRVPRARTFYACLAIGMAAASALARLHVGGAPNALHPLFAATAIVFGIALGELFQRWTSDSAARIGARAWLLGALLVAQFWMLAYDPRDHIPTQRDREAGERLLARVRALPGDVLVPFHGYVSSAAGKPAYAHQMALHDLYRSGIAWARWKTVDDGFERAIAGGQFAAVLLDGDGDGWHGVALRASYRREALSVDDDALWPRAGMRTRPSTWYLRR